MKRALPFLLISFWFFGGCQTSTVDPDPEASGHGFFPLEVKDFRIYDVSETQYLNDQATTFTYQVRERVDTLFTDASGQEAFRIVRSRRPSATASWVDDSVIVVTRDQGHVRETRHNTKVVKLVFPVKEGKSWDANAFNIADPQGYTYADVGKSFSLSDQTYPETVTVVQGNTAHLLELDQREEVYAKKIGMVYKQYTRLRYCDNESICPYNRQPTPFIQEGIRREDKLSSFGKMP